LSERRDFGTHPGAEARGFWRRLTGWGVERAEPSAPPAAATPVRAQVAAPAAPAHATGDESGILAVYNLGKSYGGRQVVKDVSIGVRRGEAVGLLGPNGAGKTTVFYMITGLVKPEKGVIELDGYDVTSLPMYQRARLGIGYLPQEASIFRGLNVEDNIRAVLEVTEPNRAAREETLNSLLEEFDIARLRKSPSIALSGGERRRCEIARALAGKPSFMLLDEPFRRHRSDRRRRHPGPRAAPEGARHRRAHHRPQCARDARPHRPRLYHP